ncbi:methylmalonyl-CoA mutase family protein [Microvirga sp. M2]|uniref:methylmalonyl-CoA mutase family protein n=1 Tax=Microvirga sp. M2 TaxID=3073270 RepID=UPI0039C3CE13
MDDVSFAADFPEATREQWLARVAGVLKGADFAKTLVARSQDGLAIGPLYPKAEGAAGIARAQAGRWLVAQRMDHPDPDAARDLALRDLDGGADALTLVTRRAPAARGFGVTVATVEDLDRALAGVMLDLIHLRLDAGGQGRVMAERLIALAERRGHTLAELSLDLGLDPIGALASQGSLAVAWNEVSARMGAVLADLSAKGFAGRVFLADGRAYHEAGASEAQELAAVLATGVSYLRALAAQGHALEAARHSLSFLLVADADEFLTVAKFRALRRLWARIEQACGLEPRPLRLHAETAWRMTTRRDPWVNLLRATVATFAAGIGGADAITVVPFTAALGLPDGLARRLARNTQLILLEEAQLWRVADPAAGAGGFEALTEGLCETAWGLFQALEREGGLVESLRQGALQGRIAAVRTRRDKAVATGQEPITGTSAFPNLAEAPVTVLLPAVREAPPEPGPAAVAVTPLPSLRTAEGFERLRDRSDAHLARTGARPRVFLANLGPVSAFTARATFAKNFFEAGGIEALMNDGFSDPAKLRQAYIESKAKLSCICSSDDIYVAHAEEASKTLRDAGSSVIYMAGRAGEREEQLIRAGITTFIYTGCDTLELLSEALEKACA